MQSNGLKSVLRVTALIALFVSCAMVRAETRDSTRITKLFTDIRAHAVLAEHDADLLDTYARSTSMSWQSHARRINKMKTHVNDLLKDFQNAKELRPEGSPWQQEAIDDLEPLLKGMAEHLTATIEHLNENHANLKLSRWRDYVRANRDYSVKTANLVRDLVDYSEAKARADSLEMKLELPTAAGGS